MSHSGFAGCNRQGQPIPSLQGWIHGVPAKALCGSGSATTEVNLFMLALHGRTTRRRKVCMLKALMFSVCAALTACTMISSHSDSETPRKPAAVDMQRLLKADTEPGQWMSHGRTFDEQRFSPLAQINTENVSQLGLAWFADLDTNRGQEATPIVVDGVIYLSTAWS